MNVKKFVFRISSIIFLLIFSFAEEGLSLEHEEIDKKLEEINKNESDKWFAMDKFLHFTASAGITGLSYHCYHCQFKNPEKNSIYFSVTFAGASGIGKELFDLKYRKTGWSWKDIVVDAAGIAAGYFLFIKLKK